MLNTNPQAYGIRLAPNGWQPRPVVQHPVYYVQNTLLGLNPLGFGPYGKLPGGVPQPSQPKQLIDFGPYGKFPKLSDAQGKSNIAPEGIYYFLNRHTQKPQLGFTYSPNLPDLKLPSYHPESRKAYNLDLTPILPKTPPLTKPQQYISNWVDFSSIETDAKTYLNRTQNFLENYIPLYPAFFAPNP